MGSHNTSYNGAERLGEEDPEGYELIEAYNFIHIQVIVLILNYATFKPTL